MNQYVLILLKTETCPNCNSFKRLALPNILNEIKDGIQFKQVDVYNNKPEFIAIISMFNAVPALCIMTLKTWENYVETKILSLDSVRAYNCVKTNNQFILESADAGFSPENILRWIDKSCVELSVPKQLVNRRDSKDYIEEEEDVKSFCYSNVKSLWN